MTGTEPPPNAVMWDGENHSLSEIYSRAGVNMVIHNADEIPNVKEDGRYMGGDLLSLEGNFSPPQVPFDNDLDSWLVVINGILQISDPNTGLLVDQPDILGEMFDTLSRKGTVRILSK